MSSDEFQGKLTSSLELQLQFLEKVRIQEARALALATDAALLRQEVETLKLLCQRFGIDVLDSSKRPEVSNESSQEVGTASPVCATGVEDTTSVGSANVSSKPSHTYSIPWLHILQELHPELLKNLGDDDFRRLNQDVKEFLQARFQLHQSTWNSSMSIGSMDIRKYRGIDTPSIPRYLKENFTHWLSRHSIIYRDESSHSAAMDLKSSSRPDGANLQQPIPSSTTARSLPISARGNTVGALPFPTPVQAHFADGSPNVHGYRAWTDIIRVRHRTFQRASPPMSKHARYFLQNHKLPLLCVVPSSSLRRGKSTFAIPESLHHTFLEYMEVAFLKNCVFGDPSLHSEYPKYIPGGGPGWEDAPIEDPFPRVRAAAAASAATAYDDCEDDLEATTTPETPEGVVTPVSQHEADPDETLSSLPDGDEGLNPSELDILNAVANGLVSLSKHKLPDPGQVELRFPTPPAPLLPNGTPNHKQYRAWTDIIRTRHPTFQRASPQMCKTARSFLHTHRVPVICLVPATSLRIGKATFSIPQSLHVTFLQDMEGLFLRHGVFGDKSLHSEVPRHIPGAGPAWDVGGCSWKPAGEEDGGYGTKREAETPSLETTPEKRVKLAEAEADRMAGELIYHPEGNSSESLVLVQ